MPRIKPNVCWITHLFCPCKSFECCSLVGMWPQVQCGACRLAQTCDLYAVKWARRNIEDITLSDMSNKMSICFIMFYRIGSFFDLALNRSQTDHTNSPFWRQVFGVPQRGMAVWRPRRRLQDTQPAHQVVLTSHLQHVPSVTCQNCVAFVVHHCWYTIWEWKAID